mmetsp:Transcript_31806/g.38462  ORF Transcript_31806/g.38462 Transcript_31806/m.38462 type:complete len:309 (-) Transcript_31806:55-981(-)|eukprot:CAMPEP_0197850558 /NCGR_PEP_ID=MMETSP1438-20131217/15714_1 /TAXON_ID=1461541 /ORGANISM="Pterosperma sp., Strain CCMP1384" /LENGTH=308 /DNA_ID=CAMNT_0043463777 /DNA_START=170 /DNA_END=1096 /DNA_ORIENTATION=+
MGGEVDRENGGGETTGSGGSKWSVSHSGGGNDEFLFTSVQIAGQTVTVKKKNLEVEDDDEFVMDANFFDEDYSIAGATGFQVWQGTWCFIDLLANNGLGLRDKLRGATVLDLGSGTGLAGLCAAGAGAHVLMTDLSQVVDGMLVPNIQANSSADVDKSAIEGTGGGWCGAKEVGGGSAAAIPLDWRKPLKDQVAAGNDPCKASVILAVECIWLKELVQPFVDTVVQVMQGPSKPECFMINGNRGKEDSKTFATMDGIKEAFEGSGCIVETIHERPSDEEGKPTVVFHIKLAALQPLLGQTAFKSYGTL